MTEKTNKRKKVETLVKLFSKHYPEPGTALNYRTPFELLIATILSAQTTDIQVNKVTKKLFKNYNTPKKILNLSQKELEKKINSIGLYRNKAKYILKTAKILIEEFNSQVPKTRKELLKIKWCW